MRGEVVCLTCSHIRTIHPSGGRCLQQGCGCEAFLPLVPVDDTEMVQRRVCIDVPDGYMVSVSLVPYVEGS